MENVKKLPMYANNLFSKNARAAILATNLKKEVVRLFCRIIVKFERIMSVCNATLAISSMIRNNVS